MVMDFAFVAVARCWCCCRRRRQELSTKERLDSNYSISNQYCDVKVIHRIVPTTTFQFNRSIDRSRERCTYV